jgi:hypothetical protein
MQDHGARAAQPPAGGDPNVRRDVGGWISGPMLDEPLPEPPVHPVPPGSTPLRELLAAITAALTLPGPATERDEVTYLRIHRDRARLVLFTCRRLLADREAYDRDVMVSVTRLREDAASLRDDQYDHAPDPS